MRAIGWTEQNHKQMNTKATVEAAVDAAVAVVAPAHDTAAPEVSHHTIPEDMHAVAPEVGHPIIPGTRKNNAGTALHREQKRGAKARLQTTPTSPQGQNLSRK